MKRVYLDQNKWIDLARADQGRPSGVKFQDALAVARAGVEQGLVSFPLSTVHYMETWHRGNWKSRHTLADTMAEVSRFHAIAPPTAVVPAEIDRALRSRFGQPAKVRPLQVFGIGLKHASGDPDFKLKWPEGAPEVDQATRIDFEQSMANEWELAMLRGPAVDTPVSWLDPWAHTTVEDAYKKSEEQLTSRLKAEGFAKGDNLRRFMLASALVDILDPVLDALSHAGLTVGDLFSLGKEELTAFLKSVSSRWVIYEMRRYLHARGIHESGDIRDLTALSIAVAYCDVVVTEKQWVQVLRKVGIEELMDTQLMSDAAQLPNVLVP